MGMPFPTLLTALPSAASILPHPTTMKTAGRQRAHQGSCIVHGTEISRSHSKFTQTVTSPLCASGGWHLTLSRSQTYPAVSCAQSWYTDLNNSRWQEQTTKAFASPFPANPTREGFRAWASTSAVPISPETKVSPLKTPHCPSWGAGAAKELGQPKNMGHFWRPVYSWDWPHGGNPTHRGCHSPW